MKITRFMALALSLLMLCAVLAGCSGDKSGEQNAGGGAASGAAPMEVVAHVQSAIDASDLLTASNVAIIPGEPLEICGGYAFGGVWGSVLCMLGLFLGSIIVFWLIRRLGQPVAEIFFSQEKLEKLHFLKHSPKRNFLFWLVFTIPGTPKDLLCYFAGLTDVSWGTWLLLCSVGRLPSVLTSTVGGSALGGRSYLFAALVFGGTLVFSLAGLLIYRNLCQKHERKGNAGDKPAE